MKDLICTDDTDNSFKLIIDTKFAAIASEIDIISYDQRNKIKCFDKTHSFTRFPIAFFVRKDSELAAPLHEIIQTAVEAGLIDFWRNRLVKIKMLKKSDTPVAPIKASQLTFILGSAALALFFSWMLFIAEIIIYRMSRSPDRNFFWSYLDWLIDGRRHAFIFNDV